MIQRCFNAIIRVFQKEKSAKTIQFTWAQERRIDGYIINDVTLNRQFNHVISTAGWTLDDPTELAPGAKYIYEVVIINPHKKRLGNSQKCDQRCLPSGWFRPQTCSAKGGGGGLCSGLMELNQDSVKPPLYKADNQFLRKCELLFNWLWKGDQLRPVVSKILLSSVNIICFYIYQAWGPGS